MSTNVRRKRGVWTTSDHTRVSAATGTTEKNGNVKVCLLMFITQTYMYTEPNEYDMLKVCFSHVHKKHCIFQLNSIINIAFYHPQRSWGKVIFSQASVILSTGGGEYLGRYTPPRTRCPPGTRCPPQTRHTPRPGTPPWDQVPHRPGTHPDQYTPWDEVHPPWDQVPPWSSACREIRATSGRYSSYWNAFLFQF